MPLHTRPDDRTRWRTYRPVQALSCWNGAVAIDPHVFLPPIDLRFRSWQNASEQSECTLFSLDLWQSQLGRILITPRVKLTCASPSGGHRSPVDGPQMRCRSGMSRARSSGSSMAAVRFRPTTHLRQTNSSASGSSRIRSSCRRQGLTVERSCVAARRVGALADAYAQWAKWSELLVELPTETGAPRRRT